MDEGDTSFLTRHHWNALPPRRVQSLEHPVGNVVSLWADTDTCSRTEECQLILRELQKKHMSQNMSDIQSNFYVGGDGNIYEGRGWYAKSPKYPADCEHADVLNGDCIEVAYIGRPGVIPDKKQLRGSSDLLTIGTVDKYLRNRMGFYIKSDHEMKFVDVYYSDSRSSFLPGNSNDTGSNDVSMNSKDIQNKL